MSKFEILTFSFSRATLPTCQLKYSILISCPCFSKVYHTNSLQSSLNHFTHKLLAVLQGTRKSTLLLIAFQLWNATKSYQSLNRNSGALEVQKYIQHGKTPGFFVSLSVWEV